VTRLAPCAQRWSVRSNRLRCGGAARAPEAPAPLRAGSARPRRSPPGRMPARSPLPCRGMRGQCVSETSIWVSCSRQCPESLILFSLASLEKYVGPTDVRPAPGASSIRVHRWSVTQPIGHRSCRKEGHSKRQAHHSARWLPRTARLPSKGSGHEASRRSRPIHPSGLLGDGSSVTPVSGAYGEESDPYECVSFEYSELDAFWAATLPSAGFAYGPPNSRSWRRHWDLPVAGTVPRGGRHTTAPWTPPSAIHSAISP
jgi:hypothetical protein